MRINPTVQPYQRSGANVPEKASKLTREMFWDAYSKTMLDSNVETMVTPIPQKSISDVFKDVMAIPGKVKQHFKDEKQKRISELMKIPYEPGLHD